MINTTGAAYCVLKVCLMVVFLHLHANCLPFALLLRLSQISGFKNRYSVVHCVKHLGCN